MFNVLDAIGTLVAGAGIAVNVAAVAGTAPARLAWRLTFAALAGTWIALVAIGASSGLLTDRAVRLSVLAFPVIAAAVLILALPAVRRALLGIPMPLLIGVNATRSFGWMFLALAAGGRLTGAFPIAAGWGDIITGVAAIPLAALALRSTRADKLSRAILAWNAFGTVDLLNAVSLGILSGAGIAAMGTLPWIFVPAFLVPFYLVTHGTVFAQLRASSNFTTKDTPHGNCCKEVPAGGRPHMGSTAL